MLFRKSSDKLLIQKDIQSVVNVDSSLPPANASLKQLTYHSAKGLQADARVFLLGDCQHLTHRLTRTRCTAWPAWARTGDPEPYDNAQKDEVLRLAYVGITRAVSALLLVCGTSGWPRGNIPRASDRVPKGKAFFEDRRAIKAQ
jgi:superfamily I DNA/RNA helicase